MELLFGYDYQNLWRNNLLDVFKKEVAKEIGRRTQCEPGRITEPEVFDEQHVTTVFRFYVTPPKGNPEGT